MSAVLFVDDEPSVLRGIELALRKDARRWKLVFALGAEAALAEIERTAIDVIVSDLRMPGMDGAELLTRVQAKDPSIVRLVLSGNADRAMMERACALAHELLDKPCPTTELRASIEHWLATRPG